MAVYQPSAEEEFTLLFRPLHGTTQLEMNVRISGTQVLQSDGSSIAASPLESGMKIPGWALSIAECPQLAVFGPDVFDVFQRDGSSEQFLGQITLVHAPLPPFTPEDIAAIRSDPLAPKFMRLRIECKKCGDSFRTYTGLERKPELEQEGWIWQECLTDRFKCKCGEQNFSLEYLKTGFHGMLRQKRVPALSTSTDVVRLYEQSALTQQCQEFYALIDSDVDEEVIQKYLEAHPIFFSRFHPIRKLMYKKPILTKYFVDFAILNERKELILVEIERPRLRLLRKNGDVSAELQHALDQVNNWFQICADHKVAVLAGCDLKLEEVSKVSGVVIAGRTPKEEQQTRRFRFLRWTDIEVLTYDDLIGGVRELTKHLANI